MCPVFDRRGTGFLNYGKLEILKLYLQKDQTPDTRSAVNSLTSPALEDQVNVPHPRMRSSELKRVFLRQLA